MGLLMKVTATTICASIALAIGLPGAASAAGPVGDGGASVSDGAAQVSADACNLVVSPTGSDSAAGTVVAPLRTSDAAIQRLGDGQTVCFRAGTFQTTRGMSVNAAHAVITSYPGENATLQGLLRI